MSDIVKTVSNEIELEPVEPENITEAMIPLAIEAVNMSMTTSFFDYPLERAIENIKRRRAK